MSDSYSSTAPSITIQLQCLGEVQVVIVSSVQGWAFLKPRTITKRDGKLPRNLFLFWMEYLPVTRDETFAAFWPNLTVKEATNVFHVTKRKISELLGFEVTHYLEGFYWLNDGIEIQSDVSLLEARWEEYSRRDTSSEEWLNLANMCQGYYLPGIKWVGIEQRREHVHNLQASILIRAATILQLDQPEGTLSLLQKALKLAPYRDDAVRLQMWTYIHLGQPTAAKALFEAYYEKVQNELGTNAKPDRQLFTLYNQLSA